MSLIEGTLLQEGKYKITRFISSGGFGCTYEAMHVLMKIRVAIKEFFVKDFCERDDKTGGVSIVTRNKVELVGKLRKKFLEEASIVYNMHHQHIVRVSDVFEENGTAYYVMDYIEGESLGSIVKSRGTLPEREAVKYIMQVADALKYVHSLNRLHLDIKPGNIMIDKQDNAILIDFGASKHYDEDSGENTSTLLGVNTRGYAPIEQMNASFTSFNPATDIYALGATLYKLLTGITPPNSISLVSGDETLQPLPQSVSESVRNAIGAAMRPFRKNRPQNIDEFMSLLNGKVDISEETIIDSSEKKPISRPRSRTVAIPQVKYWVDLGLSVKWANCNIGAINPSDYGDHFAWGEISPNAQIYNGNKEQIDENVIGDIAGRPQYDAARANWGETWRLPTKTEMDELVNKCDWEWTKINGVRGYMVSRNGNSIFLPAAGSCENSGGWPTLNLVEKRGCYWTSTPRGDGSYVAYCLDFFPGNIHKRYLDCDEGFSIRPVME